MVKKIISSKLWMPLMVFGIVFAVAALAVFVLGLMGIRVFDTQTTGSFIRDVSFLASALVLSSVIIIVSICLKP